MAEQTFKSPGFFENEIEIISRKNIKNTNIPAGVIGMSKKGPAFIPTTVYSLQEFVSIFGEIERNYLGTHAVAEFFRNGGKALTFCRVLGAGIKNSKFAGFKTKSTQKTSYFAGTPHFISAKHNVTSSEFLTNGNFSNNDSFSGIKFLLENGETSVLNNDDEIDLLRAVIIPRKDVYIKLDLANSDESDALVDKKFAIYFFNGDGTETDEDSLIKKTIISLDPNDSCYISNVLNTDATKLEQEYHYLHLHFPIEDNLASVNSVYIQRAKEDYIDAFEDFSDRFSNASTSWIISQPYGKKEYNLFKLETLSDGSLSNKYKISISNLRASDDSNYPWATFNLSIRDLYDTDEKQIVYESFSNVSLDKNANNFIGRVIGDTKIKFELDVYDNDEKRIIKTGVYDNNSKFVRVVLSEDLINGNVPNDAMPFGFRGINPIRTSDIITQDGSTDSYLTGSNDILQGINAFIPPMPYRFKITKGKITTTRGAEEKFLQTFIGEKSPSESVDLNLHWGLMTHRVIYTTQPNDSSLYFNDLIKNYIKYTFKDNIHTKFESQLEKDILNNNKFSLSKVVLGKMESVDDLTGSINDVFSNAVYIRNADIENSDLFDGLILDRSALNNNGTLDETKSITLSALLSYDKKKFNRYSLAAKFTVPMFGGYDGLNIFDKNTLTMDDRSCSTEVGGKARKDGFESGLLMTNTRFGADLMSGEELENNIVASYLNAVDLMTDSIRSNCNIICLPGIKDKFITDYVKQRVESYSKAIYLMDIPYYDIDNNRIFLDIFNSSSKPNVLNTASEFDARQINSSYVSVYFPDVFVEDFSDNKEGAIISNRRIKVPSSIVALGALAYTDTVSFPWFAPAGFARGTLNSVKGTEVRLSTADKDTLYENRINPIANFPNNQFVIFGQKTTQIERSSLDRVNVRRLVLDIKAKIEKIAQTILFEQNTKKTRDNFISQASLKLSDVKIKNGIEDFRVIMDESNNTEEDMENNILNGKIIIVPTRAVEFIVIDFIITNSGVQYPN